MAECHKILRATTVSCVLLLLSACGFSDPVEPGYLETPTGVRCAPDPAKIGSLDETGAAAKAADCAETADDATDGDD